MEELLTYVFPEKPPFLIHLFLHLISKHIKIDRSLSDRLKEIGKKGVIIYATKYPSHFDFLIYHYCLRKERLPYPRLSFDLDFRLYFPIRKLLNCLKRKETPSYRDALSKKIHGLISLIDPKRFYEERQPIFHLIQIQKDLNFPIFIVPILILYRIKPERKEGSLFRIIFGPRDKPGIFTKLASLFLKNYRKAFIDIGEPVNLMQYVEENRSLNPEKLAIRLKEELMSAMDNQKKAVLGPIEKSKQQIKEIILTDERLRKVIKEMAKGDSKKEKELKKEAERYFDEIASDFSITYATAFHAFLRLIWKKSFQGIDILESEINEIRRWIKKGLPTVYVPSHKSHIDYLVLNYFLFKNHIYPPKIAAGRNLAFWPVGYIFRKCGAFFIRRSFKFKGVRIYTLVLDRYVKFLLQEGYPIEFFIEGGRSRTGKLELPKTGFLSILINAWKEGFCKDIIFIPCSIVYDKIVEEKTYLKEIEGKQKEPESLFQVIKARRILKRNFGKIYIRFGKPISLKEHFTSVEEFAFVLSRSINRITAVSPSSFLAIPILSKHRDGFHLDELMESCKVILDFLKENNVPLADQIKKDLKKTVEDTLEFFIKEKIVFSSDEKDGFFELNEKKAFELSYYKNCILQYFLPYSFVAIALLSGREEIKREEKIKEVASFLKSIFSYEFIYDEDFDESLDKAIGYFLKERFILKEKDGFKITRHGLEFLSLWGNLIRSYIESYWTVAKVLNKNKGRKVKEEEILKRARSEGESLYELKAIKHIESISHLTFKNALKYIKGNIPEERLFEFSQTLYSLLR